MKTNKIFAAAVLAIAMLNVATSVNAQNEENLTPEQIEARLNDFNYQIEKTKKERYADNIVYNKADDPHEYTLARKYKHGRYGGIVAGVKMIDGDFQPTIGAEIGHDGRKTGWFADATWLKGHYTDEADRSNGYAEFDFKIGPKLKIASTKDHSFAIWVKAFLTYELRFDYHENNNTTTTVRETDTETITIIDKLISDYEFKGSTLGGALGLEGVWTPYWSSWSLRFGGWYGYQQYYYSDGNKWHGEWGAEIKATYNFDANEMWDTVVLKNLGLSKKQAKKLAKERARMAVANY